MKGGEDRPVSRPLFFETMSRRGCAYWRQYQMGIIHKYALGPDWDEHLRHTRSLVVDYVHRRALRSLAIVGSGWLLDVPMEELLPQLESITLIDISHPRQVELRWSTQPKVHFISLDVTAGAVDRALRSMHGREPMESLEAALEASPKPALALAVDGVVSLNLLSQLPLRLIDSPSQHYTVAQRQRMAALVQRHHLEWLSDFPTALLVTDVEESRFPLSPAQAQPSQVRPTVFIPLPHLAHGTCWEWVLDAQGVTYSGCRTVLSVVGGELPVSSTQCP